MKLLYLLLTLPLAAAAQTNGNALTNLAPVSAAGSLTNSAATNAPAAERSPTEIFADSGVFDRTNYLVTYTGNVRVEDPQMKLTCDVLTAKVPHAGAKLDSIVATSNVVIQAQDGQGRPVHATSGRAVYSYQVVNSITNETIELSGDPFPVVDRGQDRLAGDVIIWDRIKDTFRAIHPHMTLQLETKKSGTNAPAPLEFPVKK